jgi:hypothetical protein
MTKRDSTLPRSDGDEARSRKDAVRGGASRSPKEDAAVMPVGGLRKRRRDRNLAAGRRQKPKRRIQASCKSRRRLTVAGKMTTRRATVAWRKKNVFRKTGTKENCGPHKEFAAARIRTTRRAKTARGRDHGFQRQGKDVIAHRTQKRRKEEKEGLWKFPKCNCGIRDLCRRRPF